MEMKNVTRINVVGTSGSGKSTISKRLSQILNCPHVEIDGLFWGPNWYWPHDEEFFPKLEAALRPDMWVLDGNYTRANHIKWQRVQMVVWLDYSFGLTLKQMIVRTFKRLATREDLWNTGNRESIRKSFFSKDSIIWWMIRTHKRVRQKYEDLMHDPQYAHICFVRLRTHQETTDFLKLFQSSRANF